MQDTATIELWCVSCRMPGAVSTSSSTLLKSFSVTAVLPDNAPGVECHRRYQDATTLAWCAELTFLK